MAAAPQLGPVVFDGFTFAVLVVVLLVIGWGFGLAAALACRSVRPIRAPRVDQTLVIGLTLAVLVAASSTYGYARVLDAVGVIDYCDPVAAAAQVC
jgi:hypothetical protein